MNNEIGKEQLKPITWMKPDVLPVVELGGDKEFWVAIEAVRPKVGKVVICFLAMYLNKPLILDDEEPADYCLVSPCGDAIDAVGWHKSHYEFEDFYEPLGVSDNYKLLGWAEYNPQEYKPPYLQFHGSID